jgi:hypothetical protein
MHDLFLSKVSVNEPPPSFPTGPLWRELPIYKALFFTYQIYRKNFPK